MFTGIIESIGTIAELAPKGEGKRVRIATGKLDLTDVKLGDSIAVNGVCLTAVELPGDGFWADVSGETLRRTIFGRLQVGSKANLEKAMAAGQRFGGHMVSGHVDGMGRIAERQDGDNFTRFFIQSPPELARYIAEKGSITVNGISLTVNGIDGQDVFTLTIVPHTLQETTLADSVPGQFVNLEVDLIARYVERLLQRGDAPQASSITTEFLAEHGFLK